MPSASARPTPILFVHGAWHDAWCWQEHFLPYFAQHGYVAHALSFRGHGNSAGRERLRWSGIADYVTDLAQVVQRLPTPPILIGHSMGGLVVQRYLERRSFHDRADHCTPTTCLLTGEFTLKSLSDHWHAKACARSAFLKHAAR